MSTGWFFFRMNHSHGTDRLMGLPPCWLAPDAAAFRIRFLVLGAGRTVVAPRAGRHAVF